MAGLEQYSSFEHQGFNEQDVPRSHMEGIDQTSLEGLYRSEKTLLIGENYYKQEIENSAGLRGAFEDISEHGSKEEFASYYEQYVDSPNELKEKSPEIYEFLRDRVFYGREYGLTGMDAFMNRTAPERTRSTLEQRDLKEMHPAEKATQEKEIISMRKQNIESDPFEDRIRSLHGHVDDFKNNYDRSREYLQRMREIERMRVIERRKGKDI